MKNSILKSLKSLQNKYKKYGFLIVGVFGSYARDEENKESDIDILYDVNELFLKKYSGWSAILQMESIKKDIQETLKISTVDLASVDNNSITFQKMIKNELIYV